MAGASQGFHEDESRLSSRTKDLHRAIVSLQEELEAVDWYQQRADACEDPELREILEHNRDEEKEHAMMLLEWIRRRDLGFARMMKLHTSHAGPIVSEVEAEEASAELDVEGRAPGAPAPREAGPGRGERR
jgi:ferritin-like protein